MADFDLSTLTPEELHQLLALSGLNEKDALLEDQLKQAEALRNQAQGPYYGAAAGIMGGLAQGLNGVSSALQQRQIRQQQQQSIAEKQKDREMFAKLFLQRQQQQPQTAMAQPMPSASQGQVPPMLKPVDQDAPYYPFSF